LGNTGRGGALFLERGGFDDAGEQRGEASILRLEPAHDLIDGFDVVVFQPAS